jgi:hypothetical protein
MSRTYASYDELLKAIEAGEDISREDSVMVNGVPVQLKPRIARQCQPGHWRNEDGYTPHKPWLAFHYVQWGGSSTSGKAFFEVFSQVPDTFIRGEGTTIKEAEASAWRKLVKAARCPKHEFERRGYKNGLGFCKHCGMSKSEAFEPAEHCVVCGIACYYSRDTDGNWYCEDHVDQIPDEKASESLLWVRRERETPTEITSEDIARTINTLAERFGVVKKDTDDGK